MGFSGRRKQAGEDVTTVSDGRRGDFERLALPLVDSLFNFARWFTRNTQEAEDLVQETYMKAWRGFASFRGECSFRTWIFTILRNTCLSHRNETRTSQLESFDEEQHEGFLPNSAETPETIFVDQIRLSAIRGAINELPDAMRAIMLLREVEEMSYQAISTILSVPIGTVMSRLSRARRLLRDATLRKLGEDEK
jgi:RNA polymerase sigma-70 factor (ECF subfamily)